MAFRTDVSGTPTVEVTSHGGLRVAANLTRTGVFTYRTVDGGVTRELRHPDEVFHPDSLASLTDAPLTEGHPGVVTASNWQQVAKGHIKTASPEGRFVAAKVVVSHADTIGKVKTKELVELSCGYACTVVAGAGVYEGEVYDSAQTNIRYNHVGMGPAGWGRAGPEVKIKYDGIAFDGDCYIQPMPQDDTQDKLTRSDAAEVVTLRADRDTARGERDALQVQVNALTADIAALKADSSDDKIRAAVTARVSLLTGAKKVLGEVDESKSDSELIVSVLTASDKSFVQGDHSAEYLRGRFDSVVAGYAGTAAALSALNAVSGNPAPEAPKDIVVDSYEAMVEKNRNAWKGTK